MLPAIAAVLAISATVLFVLLYRMLSAASQRERESRAQAVSLARNATAQALTADLRYQALFESVPTPLCLVDASGRLTAANPAMVLLLGAGSADELNEPGALAERITGEGEFARTLELINQNGLVENRTWKLRGADEELTVTVHGMRLSEPESGYQFALSDVTALRRAETQVVDTKLQLEQTRTSADAKVRDLLEQSMEMAAVRDRAVRLARRRTEILAGLGDELQRQTAPIANTVPLILNRLPEGQREVGELLSSSARALSTTIDDLREFSRIEGGQLELNSINFSLRSLIESVADELADKAESRGIELLCLIRQGVPDAVIGDPARLRQIVLNLLTNAVEHTQAGEVSINVSLARDGEAEATIRFEVEDSGEGIDPAAIPGLFDLAPSLDAVRGRGGRSGRFGLAMSRHLVERMSGQMGVESEPGQGTLFWFAVRLRKLLTAGATAADLSVLRGMRALVVDDAASCRGVLAETLRNWGMTVATAEQAMEAVDLCQKAVAEGKPFQFILLDYELPGMNGIETAEALLDLQVPGGLILTIPPSLRHWREEPFLHGIHAALSKPIHAGDLYEALRACLAAAGPQTGTESLARLSETVTGASGGPAETPVNGESPAQEFKREEPGQFAADSAGREHAVAESAAPDGGRLQILLAEDNLVNQRVARRLVEKMGYSVEVVNDGRQAVAAARDGNYALILMDCQMPELDGLAATAEIRRLPGAARNIPIIAMTANSMRGDRERCLDAGMNDYVSKPVAFETLNSVLSYWLSHAKAASANLASAESAAS
ncbi:MAG: response regulator [Bryobacteraceae bacterium]